jgi:hypothetical protein
MTAAIGFMLLVLSSCAGSGGVPQPEKVKAAIQSLGGTPDTIYQQEVIAKDLTSGHYSGQMVFVVPSKGGGFQIVDSTGEIFRDYDDFLRNNRWPTPVAGDPTPLGSMAAVSPG